MKKFIALILAFSIISLYGSLFAKERRGVNIEIYKVKPKMEGTPWDTSFIKGELIAVKENSLLLLDSKGGDVAVEVDEIMVIKIIRKSQHLVFAGIGLILGASTGYLLGNSWYEPGGFNMVTPGFVALIGAASGACIGLIVGSFTSSDKKIQIEGKSDSEIQKTLDELRKKARVPNFQ
jgi:hypothetical protein